MCVCVRVCTRYVRTADTHESVWSRRTRTHEDAEARRHEGMDDIDDDVDGGGAITARTGRHKQRYNDARQRLVAGCICVRRRERNDEEDERGTTSGTTPPPTTTTTTSTSSSTSTKVLMINSKKGPRGNGDGRDLIFPKGGWENDESAAEAAARECLEEGGVRGTIASTTAPMPAYEFTSRSKLKAGCDPIEATCVAHVFTMQVTEVLDHWPEEGERARYWLSPSEAWRRCKHDWMRDAMVACDELGLRSDGTALDDGG